MYMLPHKINFYSQKINTCIPNEIPRNIFIQVYIYTSQIQ